jgi:heptose-I-phosphate ethanolaminephosphotransferase
VAALGAPGLCFIVLGYEGRRVAQLLTLLLPLLLWLRMPLRTPVGIMVRRWLVMLGILMFVLDGRRAPTCSAATRPHRTPRWCSVPWPTPICAKAWNTPPSPGADWRCSVWCWRPWPRGSGRCRAGWSRRQRLARAARSLMEYAVLVLIGILLLLSAAAYANKPWRRLHPVLFCPTGWKVRRNCAGLGQPGRGAQ